MKKFVIIAAILGAAISTVNAEPKSDASSSTEMIVVSKAYEAFNGLNAISAMHEELVGVGSAQKVIAVPFQFSPDTIWAMADNTGALRKVIATYEEVRKNLVAAAEAKNGGPLKPKREAVLDANGKTVTPEEPSAEQKALAEEIQKLFDSERPVGKLIRLKRGDLCIGGNTNSPTCPKDAANKIQPMVINMIVPVMEQP